MKILLIDNYDSFTYNLYHYISSLNFKVEVVRNDKIKLKEIDSKKYKKIIISPGPGGPKDAGMCINVVKKYYKTIPILGVCLGHQVIGEVFHSKIVPAKKLMHGKTSKIIHNKTGIFKNIKKNFLATRYHSLIIERQSIGKDLVITAQTKDNTIMGVMHKKFPVYGVQFHPESIYTKEGMKLLSNFLNL